MCGRYSYFGPLSILKESIQIDVIDEELGENYNVAPTHKVPVVIRIQNRNHLRYLLWGLIPFWATDPSIGSRMINARAETIADKASFKQAYRKRRCLILSNGYYEWTGPKGNKQPYFITVKTKKPFGFAGLWETWKDKRDGARIQSCTIITTAACPQIAHLHHRMPIVLDTDFHDRWLDPYLQDITELNKILQLGKVQSFTFHPVSRDVNATRNNWQELLEPIKLKEGRP